MPLVTSKAMLEDALQREYAVGAFNANNLEVAQAIVWTAEEEQAPVIVQVSAGAVKYAGADYMGAIVSTAARQATVPVALHLDHGTDFATNVLSLRNGYTSLMFDGSKLDFEDNVAQTRRVVEMAHLVGVPVEAELGKVPQTSGECPSFEELKEFFTKPEEAREFVEKTSVDSLAVSVGSAHKMKVQESILDIERIQAIREVAKLPLVLHGASGVKDDQIGPAVEAGICKINVATELGKTFTAKIKEYFEQDPGQVDVRKYGEPARAAVKETVREKMRLFGSSGKAPGVPADPGAWEIPSEVGEIVE